MQKENETVFEGFQADEDDSIHIPARFFITLLPQLEKPGELRLMLYLFWHHQQQGDARHFFRPEDLTGDPALVEMLGSVAALMKALTTLIEKGAILKADLAWMEETFFFLNNPQGRAAVEAIAKGEWQQAPIRKHPIQMRQAAPNIFKLYEENIGPITPMLAEVLKEDEATYPASWIEEAIKIAVTRNARNWKYIQAILKRWLKEGRNHEENRRNHSQDPGSYRESWLGRDK